MRVLQLIDSLEVGGAERVAVNLANSLSNSGCRSYLCATRKEGLLKESLLKDVGYMFLGKTKTIDFVASLKLNNFIKDQQIQIIHAHSSSFLLATLMKFLNKRVSIIWHDHYGNSDFLEERKYGTLKFCSKYFSYILSVNKALETWAKQKLKTRHVKYLPNFATVNKTLAVTTLMGEPGKRVICLANLRVQKDHLTLLNAFKEVTKNYPDWTLHCVGKNFYDSYAESVKKKIIELNLNNSVFLYGKRPDIYHILTQCQIGVLSSQSEGLPISLLEYGLSNLAVVATKVGECETVISNNQNGILVSTYDIINLCNAISLYIENETIRNRHSASFNNHIKQYYSEESQLQTILEAYKISISKY